MVGGDLPGTLGKDSSAHFDGFLSGAGASTHDRKLMPRVNSREERRSAPFVIAADYIDQSRPYFVKIGKDGVIPALHKLDVEMRNVGVHEKPLIHAADPVLYSLIKIILSRARYAN